ncbi:putative sulfate exporter family transporter [Streptomyces sp. HUAS MG47]|uniref:YeiH family protein n=1 Tax=Streptomyces solicamelliae TaxID=3231716 RepID=UPI003877E669
MENELDSREPRSPTAARISALTSHIPGLALASGVAGFATVVGEVFPLVGGPVAGVVVGALVAAVWKPGVRVRPGVRVASKSLLQIAVVLLGTQLSLARIFHVGAESLPVMVGSLVACLAGAFLLGRWLGIGGNLRALIGAGTGICGASAIAAVTPVIGAAGAEVAYAVSTIFVFNVAAVIVFPALGHVMGMDPDAFGLFAGTAVNDMSSVVAAATTYGPAAVDYAVVVKLTRTLMIIPICVGLAVLANRRALAARTGASASRVRLAGLVPWFLVAFLMAAAANSVGLVPAGVQRGFGELSVFLITVALSAIGLSTDLAGLRRTGPRPLVLGACLWVIVSLTSLGLQFTVGSL